MKKVNITNEDIAIGDRGCENSCPIAMALRHEYNTTNISVQIEDVPYIYVNDCEVDMTSKMRDVVEKFIYNFDNGKEVKPFTLEIDGLLHYEEQC